MNHQLLRRTNCLSILGATLVLLASFDASGDLVNLYTFNNADVTDSQSGAHGTLVDPANIAIYAGGQVRLTNNNGAGSNQDFLGNPDAVGAYIDLPNNLIGGLGGAANQGESYELTLEFWATVEENRTWARLGDFGRSNGLENESNGADQQDYLIIVPETDARDNPLTPEDDPANRFATSTHDTAGNEFLIPDAAGPLSTGVEHHIVVTVDQFDTTGGTYPNGTLKLYLDRSLVATGGVVDGSFFDITAIDDINNWLGRSQYGDALFDGSYNEFRVYSHALDQTEVEASFDAGPTPGGVAVPTLIVDRNTGDVTLANTEDAEVSIESYSISSASGSLNPAGWSTIDTGPFDPDGTWSASSVTDMLIAEAGSGDGGQIAATNGTAPIDMAWSPSPLEDAQFKFTLSGGQELNGIVEYVGDPIENVDLDADGDLDADDFALFAAGAHVDLDGMSEYQLYKHGDLNLDGVNNFFDFRMFKDAYLAANGAEAFAALFSSQAPEPAVLSLLVLGVGLSTVRRVRSNER